MIENVTQDISKIQSTSKTAVYGKKEYFVYCIKGTGIKNTLRLHKKYNTVWFVSIISRQPFSVIIQTIANNKNAASQNIALEPDMESVKDGEEYTVQISKIKNSTNRHTIIVSVALENTYRAISYRSPIQKY